MAMLCNLRRLTHFCSNDFCLLTNRNKKKYVKLENQLAHKTQHTHNTLKCIKNKYDTIITNGARMTYTYVNTIFYDGYTIGGKHGIAAL